MNSASDRKSIFLGIIFGVFLIYLIRLFYIQVIDNSYELKATQNAIRKKIIYPSRGLIYDRKGKLIVMNAPIYDLMVIPRQIAKDFDSSEFCHLVALDIEELREKLQKAKNYSPYLPSTLVSQVSPEDFAKIGERMHEFSGFYAESRTVRTYPYANAAHVLGYIGEVNQNIIDKSNKYYEMGDYIGISGIEKQYEESLRGRRGARYVYVDVHNREVGRFKDGAFDSSAVSGENLYSSLDIELQKLGEELMQGKKGSIVAIEPNTGEVLAYVSSPTYNPNELVGQKRAKTYNKLLKDPTKPLFNRPIQAQYPPGSIFKLGMSVLAQHDQVINMNTAFTCNAGFQVGNIRVRCNNNENHGVPSLNHAIVESCNSYFCQVFKAYINNPVWGNNHTALSHWHDALLSFGLGQKTGIDLPNERKGLVPTAEYYDKIYGFKRWKWTTIISLAIGQGELGTTPIQMANYISAIANRGYYYQPHLTKGIGKSKVIDPKYKTKHKVKADSIYFENIMNSMEDVVVHGTARSAFLANITILGKTGTAQNPHGKAHSVFVCFAPKHNPKIAIAAYVENAGYGSTYAAPMASMMIEKYLTDSITHMDRAKWIMEKNLIDPNIEKVNLITKPTEKPKN